MLSRFLAGSGSAVALSTVWYVLRRVGLTAQQPICRAAERDEQAIKHS